MKVCIPTMGNKGINEHVGEHFGRVPTYTLVNTKTNKVTVIDNTSEHAGGSGYPPEIIAGTGAEVMLCGGLGRRAIAMFEKLRIMVFIGASGTVKEALQMWKIGKLQLATDENACRQHAFRGIRNKHEHENHGKKCKH